MLDGRLYESYLGSINIELLYTFPHDIIGGTLTRQRFATVDRDNNFKFEYKNNFSDKKVFPG